MSSAPQNVLSGLARFLIFTKLKKGANLMICLDQQIDASNRLHIVLENISALFAIQKGRYQCLCGVGVRIPTVA